MDWQSWIGQRLPVTTIQRGGATVWPRGANGLIGDSLGPILHLHDDASEIFYFISGRCRLEIGNSEEFFGPGDFVLVPPLVPHNLWNAEDEDLLVFWLVAPNFINNKWRTDNFPPGAMDLRAIRSHVEPGVELPSDDKIRSRLLSISPPSQGEGGLPQRTGDEQEAVIYVVEGQAEVKVGKLGGPLKAHDFIHVPVATAYSAISVGGPALILLFEMPGM
jgi:mannose-6-phosphate isomerase-like protein (cupin superfamily)